jgi:hypothetical protein
LASDGIVVSSELEDMVGADTTEVDEAAMSWGAVIAAATVMVVALVVAIVGRPAITL